MMRFMKHHVEDDGLQHGDLGPGIVEQVEATPDYRAELSVPFTSEQLAALERVAREEGVSPEEAAQRLVGRALAVRSRG